MMRKIHFFRTTYIFFILGTLFLSCQPQQKEKTGWELVPEILERIVPPTFPDYDFLITDYGAVGDGKTCCTEAFRKAIEECNSRGGGRVVIPEGIFLTGAIHLKSNVNLHVSENANVLFSKELKQYLPVVYTRYEGTECMNYSPLIYAFEQENIAISGKGTLDGQADKSNWWPWKGRPIYGWKEGEPDLRKDNKQLLEMAKKRLPVGERIFGEGHYLRVNFIQPYRCKNVLIEDVTIKQSPMWEIHPVLCTNVTVRRVKTISHGPNNDGCNPESCKDVLIEDCYFDTGDDCIAIKSGRNEDGRRVGVASENIIIRGCTMKDGHGGVVIGSEISGNCRNVFAENCKMDSPNLERALRIKSNSLRGGVVENIYLRDVFVGKVADAVIRVNFYYGEGDAGQYMPMVRNINIENVTSEKSRFGLLLMGYPNSPVTDIYLKDCNFNNSEKGNRLINVKHIKSDNVTINGKEFQSVEERMTPEVVLETLKKELKTGYVERVDKATENGKTLYKFQIFVDDHQQRLTIDEHGNIR